MDATGSIRPVYDPLLELFISRSGQQLSKAARITYEKSAEAEESQNTDITSPSFTIHKLLAHDFALTEIANFLDVRSTVRFVALFSTRAQKKKRIKGTIVNPRFVPSSSFLQRLLRLALKRTGIRYITSPDSGCRLHVFKKMVKLKSLSALFKNVSGLRDEYRGKILPTEQTDALTLIAAESTITMKFGRETPTAQLTLPCKCCSCLRDHGVHPVYCGRRVLWPCGMCGEVCSECREHCATCDCCGGTMCQDCISDDGELCLLCFEDANDEDYDEEDEEEDDEEDVYVGAKYFYCEFCSEIKPAADRIDGGGCVGKDDGTPCPQNLEGECCLQCAADVFNMHACSNCFTVSCDACGQVKLCGHCDKYYCSGDVSVCPECGKLCCASCRAPGAEGKEDAGGEGKDDAGDGTKDGGKDGGKEGKEGNEGKDEGVSRGARRLIYLGVI